MERGGELLNECVGEFLLFSMRGVVRRAAMLSATTIRINVNSRAFDNPREQRRKRAAVGEARSLKLHFHCSRSSPRRR